MRTGCGRPQNILPGTRRGRRNGTRARHGRRDGTRAGLSRGDGTRARLGRGDGTRARRGGVSGTRAARVSGWPGGRLRSWTRGWGCLSGGRRRRGRLFVAGRTGHAAQPQKRGKNRCRGEIPHGAATNRHLHRVLISFRSSGPRHVPAARKPYSTLLTFPLVKVTFMSL